MRRFALVALVLLAALGAAGCRFLRSMVDTQPVVEVRREEYARPADIVGGHATVYRVASAVDGASADLALLHRHAPVLVQGTDEEAGYDPAADRIGTPRLKKDAHGGYVVSIDTTQPRFYGRVERETIAGKEFPQLVYVFWFPRRPVGVVQKGDIDGGILRVTLDAAGRPAVYEYAQTCGCLHGVFVREHLEAWAAEEFHQVEQGKRRFTERRSPVGHDWVVRDVVAGVDTSVRPVVFVSAGSHECVALQTTEVVIGFPDCAAREAVLRPYEDLMALPVDGGTASMFDANGLVWGAQRPREESIFPDLDHPGWPRRLDRVRIDWDESDWNDPRLLETFLRIPRRFQEPSAAAARLDGTEVPVAAGPLPPQVAEALRAGRPVALFFTHPMCGGCQEVEREILPTPEVTKAREGWSWIEVGLQEASGRDLASRYGVDGTPTLIVLDRQGVERRRVVGISTVRQFQEALGARP